MSSAADEELSYLITLLDQKKSVDCTLQLQQTFYSRCSKFFESNPKCIWCRYTPLAVECLHLFGLPPNSWTNFYAQVTKECLLNCTDCILAYYSDRAEFFEGLKEHYEPADLAKFHEKIKNFDLDRLSCILTEFLSSRISSSDSHLLFTLYEILSFPRWMEDRRLDELMCSVLIILIENGTMLTVSKPLPGLFYLLFHRSEQIRGWAMSVLQSKLEGSEIFFPLALDIDYVYKRSQNYLIRDDYWKSLAHCIYKFPVSELMKGPRWIAEVMNSLDMSSDMTSFVLSVFFSRYVEDVNFRAFEYAPIMNVFKNVLSDQTFLDHFDKHAEFVGTHPDSPFDLNPGQTYSFWLLLTNQIACERKDSVFVELLVDQYLHVFSFLRSKSQTVVYSIIADLIQRCMEIEGERFYVKGIHKCLEHLMLLYFRTTTSGKMALPLLEVVRNGLRFDLKDLKYQASLEKYKESDLNTSLYQALLSIFTKFPQDKDLYDLIHAQCQEIFLEGEERCIAIALSTRKYLLTYLMNEWEDRGKNSDFADQKNVMLMLYAVSVSTGVLKAQIISNALAAHPGLFVTCISGLIKNINKLDENGLSPLLIRIGLYFKIFNQVVFPNASKSILDGVGNVLFLKLHVITFSATILSAISLLKESKQEIWTTFFTVCETFWLALRSLGLDTIRQCLRENQGLSRKLKQLVNWLAFFIKHCTILSPVENARLVPFVTAMFQLSIFLKTVVPGVESQMGRYLANFKDPSADLDDLQQAMCAYEKEFAVAFKAQVPARRSKEPVVLRPPPRATIQANVAPAMSIEDLFLHKLKEESAAATAEKENPLRIPHRLPLRLTSLPHEPPGRPLPSNPAPSKPTSKLGQLKSELVKEMATLPAIKQVKRPVNPLLTTTAKAPKLTTHEISSDMDSQDEHMDDFRKEIAEISHTARHDQPHRSVKLISLSEVGVEVKRTTGAEEDDFVPLDIAKKLQRYVLELDFEGLDDRSIEGSGAMSIPDSFEDVDQYVKVFEPLLLFECRSQLLQAKLELDSMQPFDLKVSAIASVDDFHDVTVAADCEEGQRVVAENDTLYVKLDRHNPDSKVLGIVIKSTQSGRNCEATVRLLFKPHQAHLQIQLRIGLVWHAKKLCNWITTIREYSALHSLPNFRLSRAILKPAYVPINEAACETAAGILESSLGLNHSQAQAVAVALNNPNPFTLIKGPPGTGKTSTIQGLIGAIFGRPYPSLPAAVKPPRVLICAPSNAAIDEIVRRLKSGVYDCYHVKFTPRIIRLGSQEMIHEEVKEVTIDAVVEKTFAASCKESLELLKKQRAEVAQLKKDLDFVETDPRQADKLQDLKKSLWAAKENMKKNTAFIESTRQSLRSKVLNDAQVVCTTLSSAGMELLSKMQFPFVIIDEACQSVELSALIPLQYGCQNCVLVGDPNQLPPTVISQAASLFAYEQSLFQRLMKGSPESVQLLSVQYRMHPDISVFPNRYFYDGRLTDGPQLAVLNTRPWHQARELGPYRFFDIPGQEQNQLRRYGNPGTSKLNELEAESVMSLIAHLCASAPDINFFGKIGIVTPYKEQRRALRRAFGHRFGHYSLPAVEISTVDGYQGQEKEIIIFSCVRTGSSQGIGFLNDARRLNVAITRAKTSLFILGKSSALLQNELWRGLIEDARQRNCFRQYDPETWREWQRLPGPKNLAPPPPPASKTPPRPIEVHKATPQATAQPQRIKGPMQRRMEAGCCLPKAM